MIAVWLLASILLLSILILLRLCLRRRRRHHASRSNLARTDMPNGGIKSRSTHIDIESQMTVSNFQICQGLHRAVSEKKKLRPLDSSRRKWNVVRGKLVSSIVR